MKQHVHTTTKRRKYDDLASFVAASTPIHDGAYSYTNATYVSAHTPLAITCSTHGVFMQSPTNHMQGKGCPQCGFIATGLTSRSSTLQFVSSANAIWGDRWDYGTVAYVGAHQKVTITCREHGPFSQSPTGHLGGRIACTKCNHMVSTAELQLATYLATFTPVVSRDRTLIKPRELDIYMPEKALAIEYSGMYWHSHFDAESESQNKRKHFTKYQECAAQGIRLLTIYESEWQERPHALRRLLRNAIGKSRGKLMARKCDLRKVALPEAKAFYEKYHPQGGSGSGEHYGLYWGTKLVACMRFVFGANDRGAGAQNRVWTLGRYATRITVAGAASRLFKAFIAEHNPTEVKSFSDNRYFSGGMYELLGFTLEADVAPDYQVWSPKLGLRPKPHYQRSKLATRLIDHEVDDTYDAATDPRTEATMTYLMGCGRIYDCGKKRWLWKRP